MTTPRPQASCARMCLRPKWRMRFGYANCPAGGAHRGRLAQASCLLLSNPPTCSYRRCHPRSNACPDWSVVEPLCRRFTCSMRRRVMSKGRSDSPVLSLCIHFCLRIGCRFRRFEGRDNPSAHVPKHAFLASLTVAGCHCLARKWCLSGLTAQDTTRWWARDLALVDTACQSGGHGGRTRNRLPGT